MTFVPNEPIKSCCFQEDVKLLGRCHILISGGKCTKWPQTILVPDQMWHWLTEVSFINFRTSDAGQSELKRVSCDFKHYFTFHSSALKECYFQTEAVLIGRCHLPSSLKIAEHYRNWHDFHHFLSIRSGPCNKKENEKPLISDIIYCYTPDKTTNLQSTNLNSHQKTFLHQRAS